MRAESDHQAARPTDGTQPKGPLPEAGRESSTPGDAPTSIEPADGTLPERRRAKSLEISDQLRAEILALVSKMKLETLTLSPTTDETCFIKAKISQGPTPDGASTEDASARWLSSVVSCREAHGVIAELVGLESLRDFDSTYFDREQATFCIGDSLYSRISVPWLDDSQTLHQGSVGIYIHDGMLLSLTDEDLPHHQNLRERLTERGYMEDEFTGISSLLFAYLHSTTKQLSGLSFQLRDSFEDNEHSLNSLSELRNGIRTVERSLLSVGSFMGDIESRRRFLHLVGEDDGKMGEADFHEALGRRREDVKSALKTLGILRADINSRETSVQSDRDRLEGQQESATNRFISQAVATSSVIATASTVAFSLGRIGTGMVLGSIALAPLAAVYFAPRITERLLRRHRQDTDS